MTATVSSTSITYSDSTSQSTAGANSKSGNGYVKLPDGTIVQWGTSTSTSTVTFPIAFPNACGSVVAQFSNNIQTANACNILTVPTTTGFTWTRYTGIGTYVVDWIATGY